MAISKNNINCKLWTYVRDHNQSNQDKVAIVDGAASYTYGEMFDEWKKYAAVFTGLGMTGKNRARVGIIGSTSAEATFAIYGLNMVGAEISLLGTFLAFNTSRIINTIRSEKLTDIILPDDFAQPALFDELMQRQAELRIRHIILLHVPIAGSTVNQVLTYGQEYKYKTMKRWIGYLCMETLLEVYKDHHIEYSRKKNSDTAVIVHTSGTTTGMGKPIPMSDAALNSMSLCYDIMPNIQFLKEGLVAAVTIDLSNAYSIANQVHGVLGIGGTVAMVPGGAFNPMFCKAIPEHKATLIFCNGSLVDMWMKQENPCFDFSSLKCLVIGGSAASSDDKHRYAKFLRRHGAKDPIILNGYGLSELGGACILSTPDLDDESIGYVLPGIEIRLHDDDEDVFYSPEDAPCSGVMYLRSDAMTCGELDGKEIVKLDKIGSKKFVCTNDYVSMDEDGKITYMGRANRYFINNDGIKYESGRVEAEFSRQSGIESCAIVPAFEKMIHDNLPMLCVKVSTKTVAPIETVRVALINLFINEKTLAADQIPDRVMIVKEMPKNANGKVDIFKLTNGEVTGPQFKVKAVKVCGGLKEIVLKPIVVEKDSMMQGVIKSIAKDMMESSSSYNKFKSNKEGNQMNQMNPFDFFNNMNQMSTQMMSSFFQQPQQAPQQAPQQPNCNAFPFMNWCAPQQGQANAAPQMPQMPCMPPMPPMPPMPVFPGMPQMPGKEQFSQAGTMAAEYINQIYVITKQFNEGMYEQQMNMLDKINDLVQKSLAGKQAKEEEAEEEVEEVEEDTEE